MALFVEVESVEKGCKVILNLDTVSEIAPFSMGGCHLFLNDGRIYKVKDSYELFKQFAMQQVSAEDIANRIEAIKGRGRPPKSAISAEDIPKL
jgi:hypothetical protein